MGGMKLWAAILCVGLGSLARGGDLLPPFDDQLNAIAHEPLIPVPQPSPQPAPQPKPAPKKATARLATPHKMLFTPGETVALDGSESVASDESDGFVWDIVQVAGEPLKMMPPLEGSPKDPSRRFFSSPTDPAKTVTYRIKLYVSLDGHGDSDSQVITFGPAVDPAPAPQPQPVPPAPPAPPNPIPVTDKGLRVLIVEDAQARYKLTRPQQSVLTAVGTGTVRDWMNANCVKGLNGWPEWRVVDKDADMSRESPVWQAFYKAYQEQRSKAPAQLQPLPWLVASNGTEGTACPLGADANETLAILRKFLPKAPR